MKILIKTLLVCVTILFLTTLSFAECGYMAVIGDDGDLAYTPPPIKIINPGYSSNGVPDMKIKTVNMSKGSKSTRHSTLYQDPGEKFYAYAKIKNSGDGTAHDFKIKFYIDGGNRNTNGDDDDYEGSVRIDTFNVDAEIRYNKELTSPSQPGTYWVYACITSIDEDSDQSNNCSDEDDREKYGELVVEESVDESGRTEVNANPSSAKTVLPVMQYYLDQRR